ncbi:hypothetical protein L3Q82_024075 [Scortum barcoo]|uniref:Uncharacterized protein n=1 Tax=Scortum barcoo TaxID=214431 RepID=A0ACB8WW24_9TELE|nr:hypothetical protein L3Q82_024075 [Scortum barcoo]
MMLSGLINTPHVHQSLLSKSLAIHSDALPSGFQHEDDHGFPVIGHWTEGEIRAKQRADPDLRVVIEHKESGDMPTPSLRQELPDLVLWLRERKRLELKDGIHFTKYAVAIPTRNQKAQTVAKCLWENFLVHYGFPEKLLSDQGPDFESRTIKELCSIAGIQKVRTTPYHPRGNPVERFNRTLLQILGTLENKDKSHWREFVKPLVHAYNCTRNDVTGYSPYELMFGRQPRLPVDLAFGLPASSQPKSHSQYVHDLKGHLEESYRVATENASKTAERNKQRFDKRVVEPTLEAGDRVLVRNVRIRGKHKLADKWESAVHIVVKCAGELPVYTVKPEGKDGPLRKLHRDLLLPCGFLPVARFEKPPKQTINKPRTRRQSRMEVTDESEVADGNSESEDNDYYYYSPGETLNTDFTDFIETRLLTRPETVPSRERHLRETKHPMLSTGWYASCSCRPGGKGINCGETGQRKETCT